LNQDIVATNDNSVLWQAMSPKRLQSGVSWQKFERSPKMGFKYQIYICDEKFKIFF